MGIFFSDIFEIEPATVEEYGALDISLINDLPLFVDPFLLFSSDKQEYQELHQKIIDYLCFLKEVSSRNINEGLLYAWFKFPEVKQNWLGYSKVGNSGSGLGNKFAQALNSNLNFLFDDFGVEKITTGSHLEKVCLIKDGVGRDNISDFTTNLIKSFLLDYTQEFALKYLSSKFIKEFNVEKVNFDYNTRKWLNKRYHLPSYGNDYVLLTPKDILTKDETWINKKGLFRYEDIIRSVPNKQLRAEMNDYLNRKIPKKPKQSEKNEALLQLIEKYPSYIDYYIKLKEDSSKEAKLLNLSFVKQVQDIFISNVTKLTELLSSETNFYETNSKIETNKKLNYLKHFIEDLDGYRLLYYNNEAIKREQDIQLLFKLVWHGTEFDVNAEVNNGRGPADFKVSKGNDKTVVEFKLASNPKLNNVLKQTSIYMKANQTNNFFVVIIFYNDKELEKVNNMLKICDLENKSNCILIDARRGKISASNVS